MLSWIASVRTMTARQPSLQGAEKRGQVLRLGFGAGKSLGRVEKRLGRTEREDRK